MPLHGPENIYYHNQGVVKNTSTPKLTLSKKHNLINYHIVREVDEARILSVGKEDMGKDLINPLTNLMPYNTNQAFLGNIQYDY